MFHSLECFVLGWFDCLVLSRSNGSIWSLRPFLCFVSALTIEQRLRWTGKYRSSPKSDDLLHCFEHGPSGRMRKHFEIEVCTNINGRSNVMTRTAVTCWSVGSQVGKQTGDPRRFVGRCRSQTVLMCSRVNIFWVGGGAGGSKGGRPPSLSRPPGAGAGHHQGIYTPPPGHRLYGRQTKHTLCPQSCGFVYSPEDKSGATHCH